MTGGAGGARVPSWRQPAAPLQIKPPPPPTPTPPGPPTTPTTTSSPRALCPALPRRPRPPLPRASPLSPHPPASQTTLRPGKSITRRSVSAWASAGAQASPGLAGGGRVPVPRSEFSSLPPAGQQPQQPGAPPQQDYTKAWEEYYKKQGELLGRRGRGRAWPSGPRPHSSPGLHLPAAQVATGGGPGAPPGSQPDYSAAWAEYYRQQAAYYGQTPGPGGPQPPPTQQGQQQASGNCHPPPPPFSFQPPATVHPALVGSAGNPFPCGVCP